MNRIKENLITFAFIIFIGIIIMIFLNYIGANPNIDDCAIGRDSEDCLEGGSGHPLW